MEDDLEDQANELLALGSIYEEGVFSASDDRTSGKIEISVQLPDDFSIKLDAQSEIFVIRSGARVARDGDGCFLSLAFLPPLELYFQFPSDYPSCTPPAFTLSCKWLSPIQLSHLCRHLDELWDENRGLAVLFSWIQFLQEETLTSLGLSSLMSLDYGFIRSISRQNSRRSNQASRQTSHDKADQAIGGGDTARSSSRQSHDVTDGVNVPDGQETSSNQRHVSDEDSKAILELVVSEMINGGGEAANMASTFSTVSSLKDNVHTSSLKDYLRNTDPRAVQESTTLPSLISSIVTHDKTQKQKLFISSWFECQICFEEKSGLDCLPFEDCTHVHCKECMTGYFEVQIEDGSVTALVCPDRECKAQAHPRQVRNLVSDVVYQRYERLLLKTSLDRMADVINCSKQGCECPVVVEADGRLAICPRCLFPFCPTCLKQYHGVAPCYKPRPGPKLKHRDISEGANTEANDDEEEDDTWVYDEQQGIFIPRWEEADLKWIRESTKDCPNCQVHIEKQSGCNKMTCRRCGQYFCWVCLKPLKGPDPYLHFRGDSTCNMYELPDDEFDND